MLFLVDENLPTEVADQLRGAGNDATTVFERRLVGETDMAVAAVCRTERRALLTLDLDFANTLLYPPKDYVGLVVLRLERQDKPSILKVTAALIARLAQEELEGRLWVVDEERIRIR